MEEVEGGVSMQTLNPTTYIENMDRAVPRRYDYTKVIETGNWEDWQRKFREELRETTGLAAVAAQNAGLPLKPRQEGVEHFPTYTREKMYIQSEPGIEIAFYLLLPKVGQGPFPLVLTPHGHGRRGKEVYVANFESEQEEKESMEGDRDIAVQAVEAGYAAIAMDVRGFWEMGYEEDVRKGKNNSCTEMQKRAYMYGRTLIGERVYDMGRLIDYASTRPEIDDSRIAITGNSGGGTVSLFTAALDERISVCVPGSYFNTFHASIMGMEHCLCNHIPGMMHLGEMYDVVGLIAPRPLLAVNGVKDPIYPSAAAKEAFEHVQRIYEARGVPERCELYLGHGGHRYYKAPVWPFMKKYL
jgi:dienelactone hydrolase